MALQVQSAAEAAMNELNTGLSQEARAIEGIVMDSRSGFIMDEVDAVLGKLERNVLENLASLTDGRLLGPELAMSICWQLASIGQLRRETKKRLRGTTYVGKRS